MSYGDGAIYLDHAATTPVDPAVVELMLPWFTREFGNPSSIYQRGQAAHAALDRARKQIAGILRCAPSEVIFTSGATESNGTALKGVAWAARLRYPDGPAPHIITSAIEHHAVLHAADSLERQGFAVTRIGCDRDGVVSPQAVADAIRPETCLISIMYANNEIGTFQPIAEIGALAREHGIPFHTDAVQAAGVLSLDVQALNVDMLSLSAHKFYGPKGVGVLYLRKQVPMEFQQVGGGQESGRRGGTENVPLIVGMAEALVRADTARDQYNAWCRQLRDSLWTQIEERIPAVTLNGPPLDGPRLPNNLNITIDGVQGETVLLSLDMGGVAASAGSACTTGNTEPSHVLLACGLSEAAARSSMRLTVGRGNSMDEIDEAVDILVETVERVRMLAGVTV
ncbi:MAG TPA: cysteine desulfurase family protein [Thermomicrobiales bacterium]|nr:cysteine desulfurase family protein [Thermomicrobiales bacterium]